MLADQPCSAALPAATYGTAESVIARRQLAISVTRISWGSMVRAAVASVMRCRSRRLLSRCGGTVVSHRFVVLTGGEPLLQVDDNFLSALHELGFEIAIETNGSLRVPSEIDWITVSPKGSTPLAQTTGNELKLVFPQKGVDPAKFESLAFKHFLLQPLDGPERESNTAAAIAYCLQHPRWCLSLQTHKFMGIR